MNVSEITLAKLGLLLALSPPTETIAQQLDPIRLIDQQTGIGKPLMEALKNRKSSRSYSSKELSI